MFTITTEHSLYGSNAFLYQACDVTVIIISTQQQLMIIILVSHH